MHIVSCFRMSLAMLLLFAGLLSYGQTECVKTFAFLLGSPNENERGHSLAPAPEGDALYVAGSKGNNAMILKMLLDGTIEWARTFNVDPGRADQITEMLVDSEGMIVAGGNSGSTLSESRVFVMKYDPYLDTVLWANTYLSTSANEICDIIELNSGNYLIANDPQAPNDSELIEIHRSTGFVTGQAKHYHLGSSESIFSMVLHNGRIFASARFTDGGSVAQMRSTLLRINPQDLEIDWIRMGHRPGNVSARLYTAHMIIHNDHIASVTHGDENGPSITTTQIFIYYHTLDGNLIWAKKYDLPIANDWSEEIIDVGDGFVVMCRNGTAPSDIILFKTDYLGNVLWAKNYDFLYNDTTFPTGKTQSQIVKIEDYIYFTAYGVQSGNSDLIVAKVDIAGSIGEACSLVSDINVIVSDVANPVFYTRDITTTNYVPQRVSRIVTSGFTDITHHIRCFDDSAVSIELFQEICAGQSYSGYTTSGIYLDHYVSTDGCDSTRILHLTVIDTVFHEEFVEICVGESYAGYSEPGVYQDHFIAVSGCDSIRTLYVSTGYAEAFLNVTICEGDEYDGYTLSGVYFDTLSGTFGACDTSRKLTLSVIPAVWSTEHYTMCPGDSYYGYTTEGLYVDTLASAQGCDSIRMLILSIEIAIAEIAAEICAGEMLYGYSQQGMYLDTLPGQAGACDTARLLHLWVIQPVETMISAIVCVGESIFGYSTPGMYVDTLTSFLGCDSIRILHLEVAEVSSPAHVGVTLCNNAFGFTMPGQYIETLVAQNGCDSIVIVTVGGIARFIPNVFSPNGDGVNDIFEVHVPAYDEMEIEHFAIFDRFGGMVYETRQWPVQWDGRGVEGQVFNPGVFAWMFIYVCNGRRVIESGDVTLVR